MRGSVLKMHSYYTELDIEECKRRIHEIVSQNTFSAGAIKGKVHKNNNTFYLIKPTAHVRNSFAKFFYGNLIKRENGTLIQGNFRMHIAVKIFLAFWFGIITFTGGGMFLFSFINVFLKTSIIKGPGFMVGLLVPPLMILGGILAVKLGSYFSKKGEKYVLEFIESTLESREVFPGV
jgi:hypothetical protein